MYAKNNISFICSFTCPVLVERYIFKHLELRNKDPPSTQLKQLTDTLSPTDVLFDTPGNSPASVWKFRVRGLGGPVAVMWEDTDAMLGTH